MERECIPVGCVPSAAVAISPAMHPPAMHAPCHARKPPAMHTPCHGCPSTMHAPHHPHTHTPWTEFLTHTCENITFLQLLLQMVKIRHRPKMLNFGTSRSGIRRRTGSPAPPDPPVMLLVKFPQKWRFHRLSQYKPEHMRRSTVANRLLDSQSTEKVFHLSLWKRRMPSQTDNPFFCLRCKRKMAKDQISTKSVPGEPEPFDQ